MFHKRVTITGVLLLLLTGTMAGAVPEGVVKIQTELGGTINGKAQTDITLRNDSPKTITAWAWTVEGKYADGSTSSHSGIVDVISDLLAPNQSQAFRPGVTREFHDALPLGPYGERPISVDTRLTMLVFDDDTAVGDGHRIARFASSRKSMAALEADELDEIQKALKDPAPKNAVRAAIAERQARGQSGGMLQQVLSQLERKAPAEAVEAAQSAFRAHQELLAAHSKLEVK